jgi:hypothetical protein
MNASDKGSIFILYKEFKQLDNKKNEYINKSLAPVIHAYNPS